MKEVRITDNCLQKATQEGMDVFLQTVTDGILTAIGGELNEETIQEINAQQITLLAYHILRDEVMDGGFVQLIHNGYGPFIFKNPFDKAIRAWGLADLCSLIRKVHKLYNRFYEEIERECSDEEFMAMFEQMPEFDEFDDRFVENEEEWTAQVARYVDEHISQFAEIEK
ncbi:MAG: DMP19 family protein [Hoylesella marshii]|uniref:DMP19 family protein n=1 Tax=Hoylesella marshii TaxID=189722 RepID=UPI003FA17D83